LQHGSHAEVLFAIRMRVVEVKSVAKSETTFYR